MLKCSIMHTKSMSFEALKLSQSTQNGLDYLANHDVKAIAYPVLVQEGPLTTTGLARVVSERAGLDTDFVVTYPKTYVQGGFAEIEKGTPHRGVPRRLFRTTQEDLGLSVTGAMLDWSETHDIPLISTLSATASKGSRAPVNTIQLLHGMLAGANVGEITDTRYKKTKQGWDTQHNIRLRKMVSEGLVDANDEEPSFKILDPEYKGSKPFHLLDMNQQNLYMVLSAAKNLETNSGQKWTLSEIEHLAVTLFDFSDDKELQDFNKRLVRVVSVATPRYSPGVTEKIELSGRRYSVAPHFVNAAADLVERVIQLDSSPSKQRDFQESAHIISRDSSAIKRVVGRGIQTSPYINARR